MFSSTGLRKLLNQAEVLLSYIFSFQKMGLNGTVSHEVVHKDAEDMRRQDPWTGQASEKVEY